MFKRVFCLLLGVAAYAEPFMPAPQHVESMKCCCTGKVVKKSCTDCPQMPSSTASCCSKTFPATYAAPTLLSLAVCVPVPSYEAFDSGYSSRADRPSIPPPKSLT